MKGSSHFRAHTGLYVSTSLLLGISILMVFSTTAIVAQETVGRSTAFLNKHLLQIGLGLFFCFLATRINPRFLGKLSFPILLFSLLSLLAVMIPGIGSSAGGATRWLSLGPIRLQPGEISKFAVVLYIATYIGRHHEEMFSFLRGIVVPLLIVATFGILLLSQPDFGSTSIIFLVVLVMLFTASRVLHLVSLGVVGALSMAALIFSSPYRLKRVESFLDPFVDASAGGYQLVQSLIAVGSGGLLGEGLGAGRQKLFYLPAAHTDFIFAVIAEELGLIGVLFVVSLFLLFAYSGIRIAKKFIRDPFYCSLAVGLTALIVVPAFLNMGVVLGLLPTKGLVLPLVAYGGTAMVINLWIVGILIRLSHEDV